MSEKETTRSFDSERLPLSSLSGDQLILASVIGASDIHGLFRQRLEEGYRDFALPTVNPNSLTEIQVAHKGKRLNTKECQQLANSLRVFQNKLATETLSNDTPIQGLPGSQLEKAGKNLLSLLAKHEMRLTLPEMERPVPVSAAIGNLEQIVSSQLHDELPQEENAGELGSQRVSTCLTAGAGLSAALILLALSRGPAAAEGKATSVTDVSGVSTPTTETFSGGSLVDEGPIDILAAKGKIDNSSVETSLTAVKEKRDEKGEMREKFFTESEGGTSYIVQKGDNLWSIAQIFFDGDMDALLNLNPQYVDNSQKIHAGNSIKLSPQLIIGGMSCWDAKPLKNNEWIEPGEADPPFKWKDTVLHRYGGESGDVCDAEHPFVVVTIAVPTE